MPKFLSLSSVLAAVSVVLSACGTPPAPPPASPYAQGANPQLELALASGTYGCEGGVSIRVEREVRDNVNYRIHLVWNGNSYRLLRDPSYSGLPRFVDASSQLVWIDLPWKGLLLDAKTNQPLVNECHAVQGTTASPAFSLNSN